MGSKIRVFATPELLEAILLLLPERDLFLSQRCVRRICLLA